MNLILVIDDQKESRQAIREMLQRNGYEVTCAMDGEHALEKISQHSVTAAVMEDLLAGASGMEVLRRIHRVAPQLPVVIVAEHPSPEAEGAFVQVGAHAYLPKSNLHETLPTMVQDAVDFTVRLGPPRTDTRDTGEH